MTDDIRRFGKLTHRVLIGDLYLSYVRLANMHCEETFWIGDEKNIGTFMSGSGSNYNPHVKTYIFQDQIGTKCMVSANTGRCFNIAYGKDHDYEMVMAANSYFELMKENDWKLC